jgi:hypothetical protein
MSFASTLPEGELATYESQTLLAAKDCYDFRLERWNGCACQPSNRPLITFNMCNQDSLWKSSDETEGDGDGDGDWSDEEETSRKAGMLNSFCLCVLFSLRNRVLLYVAGFAANISV